MPNHSNATPPSLVPAARWRSYLTAHRDWFLAQESVKTDETKRVGKLNSCMDDVGCPGSFRTLTVD